MDDQVLKGNFKLKKPVNSSKAEPAETLKEKVKKRVLAQLGGSMVYVERDRMNWDGDE